MGPDVAFVAEVAERAGLGMDEARDLIDEFLHTLAGFVDAEAWELIASLLPTDSSPDLVETRPEQRGIEDFLSEMSNEENVELERSAEHARAVAETIRSRATPEQIDRLRSLVGDEGILALFETSRGELTTSESPMGRRER